MYRRSWTVTDIADFEFLLRSQRSADSHTDSARDRQIYLELLSDAPADAVRERRDLLRSWLEARRFLAPEKYFGGADLVRSWKLLVTAAMFASFVGGVLHAGGVLLLLDQNGHVSATKAALATVGVQIMFTLFAALLWTVRGALRRIFGEFSSLRVSIARAVLPRLADKSRRRKFSMFLEQIGDLEQSYRELVMCHVIVAAQLCVVAMSLGLLASLDFYHFMSSDIRFGWSMTHDVSAETVHRGIQLIASPWSGLTTAGVPSLSQVVESRLSREATDRVVSIDASRAWATFLSLAILTYGVLLRLVFLLLAGGRAMKAGREPVLRGPPVDELIRRMTTDLQPQAEAAPMAVSRPWWRPWGRKGSSAKDTGQPRSGQNP